MSTTNAVRHVGRIPNADGGSIDILEAYGARLTPIQWERDEAALTARRHYQWHRAVYLVHQVDRPQSEPTVLQWRKHTPRTGQWIVGPYRFSEDGLRIAVRQCLADIAAREGRYAD